MGESRTELIAWLNDLLQLSYTKVEQAGTGAAYCQVMDSIYGDVPLARCKFNAKQEYEYLANYKVLQNTFKAHGIDKPIAVDKLIKCKMQDNLEFLQWFKRFWDSNYPGGEYDAVARRRGEGMSSGSTTATLQRSAKSPVTGAGKPLATSAKRAPRALGSGSRSASSQPDQALIALTQQMNEMKITVEGLEKERDFYFNKLRDIEIIIGARLESAELDEEGGGMSEIEMEKLKEMQAILYSTEDGFEVPDEGELVDEVGELHGDEEETF